MATSNNTEEFIDFTIVFVKPDGQYIEVDRTDNWEDAACKVSLYNGGTGVLPSMIGRSLGLIEDGVSRVAQALEAANASSGYSTTIWQGFQDVVTALEGMQQKSARSQPNSNTLTGKFFHSFAGDGSVEWQGHVIVQCDPDTYCVQLFEWMLGTPSIQKVVSLETMAGWTFYETLEQMNDTYGRKYAGRGRNV
jgi:hypothetical protein